MTWDTSPIPPYTAAVPAAVAERTPPSATAPAAENRVRGFSPLTWDCYRPADLFIRDRVWDFQLPLRQLTSAKVLDSESGLYYLRARYYDPATAQFMSVDPMVDSTMSPYAYVSGNPLNATDPSGQFLDYTLDYNIGSANGISAAFAMSEIKASPEAFFPFGIQPNDGGSGSITKGAGFNLSPVGGPSWQVSVTNVTATSFTLTAGFPHGDMPGSTITFATSVDAQGDMHLNIHGIAYPWLDLFAFLPFSSPQDDYMKIAENLWPTMAERLKGFVDQPLSTTCM